MATVCVGLYGGSVESEPNMNQVPTNIGRIGSSYRNGFNGKTLKIWNELLLKIEDIWRFMSSTTRLYKYTCELPQVTSVSVIVKSQLSPSATMGMATGGRNEGIPERDNYTVVNTYPSRRPASSHKSWIQTSVAVDSPMTVEPLRAVCNEKYISSRGRQCAW